MKIYKYIGDSWNLLGRKFMPIEEHEFSKTCVEIIDSPGFNPDLSPIGVQYRISNNDLVEINEA